MSKSLIAPKCRGHRRAQWQHGKDYNVRIQGFQFGVPYLSLALEVAEKVCLPVGGRLEVHQGGNGTAAAAAGEQGWGQGSRQ